MISSLTVTKTIDELILEARLHLPERLSPAAAAAAMTGGALLVDIREDDQRRADGLIPDAIVVPRNSLEWRCDPASSWRHPLIRSHDQQLILICNQGFQSSLAAATLQRIGLRFATDVVGGFTAWRSSGMPVVPFDSTNRSGEATPDERRWDSTYESTELHSLSWFQRDSAVSLRLIEELGAECIGLDDS